MAHPEHALSESDRLGRQLVLDEVFDLSLYRALRDAATGRLRGMLDELILVETRHVAFWQEFFGLKHVTSLDLAAVSGFFAAFRSSTAVLAAGFTVAVAGAMSMAAGAYIGAGSEAELRATEDGRRRFLRHRPAGKGRVGDRRLDPVGP